VITAGEAMVLFAAQQPGPLEQVGAFTRATAGAELNVAIGPEFVQSFYGEVKKFRALKR
jgi:hypothetical protein